MKFRTKLSKGAKVQLPLHLKRKLDLSDGDFITVDVSKLVEEENEEEEDVWGRRTGLWKNRRRNGKNH